MNWAAIGAVAELLGAIGVIASLLYLARQMRSNAAQNRLAAVQSVLTKLNDFMGVFAANEQLNSVWVRGSGGMAQLRDQEEATQFSSMNQRLFRAYEELVQYRQAGWVDDWAWESVHLFFLPMQEAPGVLDWWVRRRGWFRDEFQTHIESLLSSEALGHMNDSAGGLSSQPARAGEIMGPEFDQAPRLHGTGGE